jgi:DNA-binding response OmpR family regulator
MTKYIIAIEDDPQIAELISLLLESAEVDVEHLEDGVSGLQAVMAHPPDLVLLDIMIPGMNGWEVHQRIRENETTQDVPIIVISVTQQPFDRRVDFVRSGIDFYIAKPFDVLMLRSKVKELLQVSHFQVRDELPPPVVKGGSTRPLNIAAKLLDGDEARPKPRKPK